MGSTAPASSLGEAERSELRYRLESLSNEMELLIRNQRSDASDSARIGRAFEGLRVLDRIPLQPELASLRAELESRAKESGVKVVKIELLGHDRPKKRVPAELYSDTPSFKLEPDQIGETLHIRLYLAGDGPAVEEWIQRWPYDQLRLIEPEAGYKKPGLKPNGAGRFTLRARAFRFRDIHFPKLKPRDPISLLPAWARKDPGRFAATEPLLWQYIRNIQERIPLTAGPFDGLRELLLDKARMSFFLSKTK
jgi:hypothetical protein